MLKENETVYVTIRQISESGLSRKMSFFKIETWQHDGSQSIRNITDYVAEITNHKVTGDKYGRKTIKVVGAGMDMGYHIVEQISQKLKIKLRYDIL